MDGQVSTIDQQALNRATWEHVDLTGDYSDEALAPVERHLLDRHRAELADAAVLELGPGTGRVTRHLVDRAREVHAIEISASMVARCRAHAPGADVRQGDMRDLSPWATGTIDVVVGAQNILDALDPDGRDEALREIHRVLRPGGLLIFSAHNRAYIPRLARPKPIASRRPSNVLRDLRRYRVRRANHARLRPHERETAVYAIVNDDAHDFAFLHYYIAPPAQARQLEEHGFEVLEAVGHDQRPLGPADEAPEHSRVHYVARRR